MTIHLPIEFPLKMLRIHGVALIVCVYFCYCVASKGARKQSRYEVVLTSVQNCPKPNPVYAKKVTLISKYSLNVVNGKRFFSGNTSVTAPTLFTNFSARTYSIDNAGNRVIKFQITEVTCRNVFARIILMFSNVSFSVKTCVIDKGFYRYENLDVDRITHSMPGWHGPGDVLHELQLVTNGTTEFCNELAATINEAK